MFVQKRHATEGPGAGATLVLLHLRVGLHVGAQVGAIGEGPATVLTSKGALTWLKKQKKKRERQSVPAQHSQYINKKSLPLSHCFSDTLEITENSGRTH